MVERAGWGDAMLYLLTGDEFGAEIAHRMRFVQEIVEPGRQLERAIEIAERIAAQAPLAVAATLASARKMIREGQLCGGCRTWVRSGGSAEDRRCGGRRAKLPRTPVGRILRALKGASRTMCIVCGPGGSRFIQSIAGRYASGAGRHAGALCGRGDRAGDHTAARSCRSRRPEGTGRRHLARRTDLDIPRRRRARTGVAVRAGRIQAVGDEATVLAFRGRLTRTIELDGRALLPGFVIADWHPPLSLLCDWLEADQTTATTLAAAIAERSGEWLVLRMDGSSEDRSKAPLVTAASRPAVILDRDGIGSRGERRRRCARA